MIGDHNMVPQIKTYGSLARVQIFSGNKLVHKRGNQFVEVLY